MGDLDGLYAGYSTATASAWAKLDSQSAETLPLFAHLADAACVAGWLWDNFLPLTVRSRLATSLGGPEKARVAAVFMAGAHDIGKLTPGFAQKAEKVGRADVVAAMQRAGLHFPKIIIDVPHGTTGHLILSWWLCREFGFTPANANTLATVVGGHHGTFPERTELRDAQRDGRVFGQYDRDPDELDDCPWHIARMEILSRMAETTGASDTLGYWRGGWPPEAQILLGGIVILADWIASNVDFFPYTDVQAGRLEGALEALELPPPWQPGPATDVDALFSARFPALFAFRPSPLQRAAVAAAAECSDPPLIIIEAPMGDGKTEAAQLAAEVLAHRFGAGGIFFGLPTMATANPMFDRVLGWLNTALSEDHASVMLAHSKASHHDSFRGLLRESRVSQIHDDEEDVTRAGAVVASWLSGRKKATHASFVVGTVDQLLFMALRAKHVSLRQLAMAGKVVIIDECHAADDYMRVYLCRALTWLARMGTPVILMSATLPPAQRQEFVDAYAAGCDSPTQALQPTTAYPLITTHDGSTSLTPVEPGHRSSTVRFAPFDDDLTTLVEHLRDQLRDGGCAAVIRNTVTRAQETFDVLEAAFGEDVLLIHSRFVTQHRSRLEGELVDKLGRGGKRPHRLIVVGTQVLEQSLDVDFDLMVSDLAPMDLVLQRAGRLHRHPRGHRPSSLKDPVLLVTGTDLKATPPEPDAGSKAVYGASKLLRAASLIPRQGRSVHFPREIPELVMAAYSPDALPPPGWEEAWVAAEQEEAAKVADQQRRASNFLVSLPEAQRSLVGFSKYATSDPESPRSQGKQQVRDAVDGLEVIVLRRREDGALSLLDGLDPKNRTIPSHWLDPIPEDLARLMASTTLSLPTGMTNHHFDAVEAALNNTIDYTNWENSLWLKGQLALVLDDSLQANVANYHLTYHPRKGLMYERMERASDGRVQSP